MYRHGVNYRDFIQDTIFRCTHFQSVTTPRCLSLLHEPSSIQHSFGWVHRLLYSTADSKTLLAGYNGYRLRKKLFSYIYIPPRIIYHTTTYLSLSTEKKTVQSPSVWVLRRPTNQTNRNKITRHEPKHLHHHSVILPTTHHVA